MQFSSDDAPTMLAQAWTTLPDTPRYPPIPPDTHHAARPIPSPHTLGSSRHDSNHAAFVSRGVIFSCVLVTGQQLERSTAPGGSKRCEEKERRTAQGCDCFARCGWLPRSPDDRWAAAMRRKAVLLHYACMSHSAACLRGGSGAHRAGGRCNGVAFAACRGGAVS